MTVSMSIPLRNSGSAEPQLQSPRRIHSGTSRQSISREFMSNKRSFRSTRRLLLKGGLAGALAAASAAGAQSDEARRGAGKMSAREGDAREAISPLMRTVAAYIVQSAQKPLPDAVTEATKHHVLDTLAAMI